MQANKLSELMRTGAKLHKQGRWNLASNIDGEVCTCAMGAVYEAAFHRLPDENMTFSEAMEELTDALPNGKAISAIRIKSPVSQHLKWSIYGVIMELNDMAGWQREDIADWLEKAGY